MVTCWERANPLALLCVCVCLCCVLSISHVVPWVGVLYLIVSIPDLDLLIYFEILLKIEHLAFLEQMLQPHNIFKGIHNLN